MLFFPRLRGPRSNPEERVSSGRLHLGPRAPHVWTAIPELSQQVRPFVANLSPRHRDQYRLAGRTYLASVERVAAGFGFVVDRVKITGDGSQGARVVLEAGQLRVRPVAASAAAKHCLCQQSLAPKCHQPLRIKIFRMQGPKAHEP